jgi:RNA polymerase primary sigma factor
MAKRSEFDLSVYLNEVNKVPLLSRLEERKLALALKKGNKKARKRFIQANLRLVINIAKKYRDRGLPFLDLIEEGNLGLLTAVERFDPKRGVRFSTYATWWIKHYIIQALLNTSKVIRIPTHIVEVIAKWKHASRNLTQKLGRSPEIYEVTKEVQVSPERLRLFKETLQSGLPMNRPISLDLIFGKGVLTPPETCSAIDDIFEVEEMERLKKIVDSIDDKEARVLKMRYGLESIDQRPMPLRTIARRLHCSPEWVRLLEKHALEKLHYLLTGKK